LDLPSAASGWDKHTHELAGIDQTACGIASRLLEASFVRSDFET